MSDLKLVQILNASEVGTAQGKIKISSDDTTADYTNGKLVAGEGIDLTEGTPGGNETLTVAGEDASDTNKGIASFAAADFDITAGAVTLDSSVVKEADVDDTPANGALTDPVSSNWAFDHNANTDAHHAQAHAASHTNGTDDIQSATALQKGVATAAQITKLDGIEALADVTDATNVAAAGAVMDGDFSAAEGFMRKTGAGAYEAIKSNLAAAVDPTANDDSGDGYAVSSNWINTTDDKHFICLDATPTAAVWTETTAAGGAGGQTLYDAIVAASGGDYTTVGAAITAGKVNIFVTNGTYSEVTNVAVPANGMLVGESPGGVILDFASSSSYVVSTGEVSTILNITIKDNDRSPAFNTAGNRSFIDNLTFNSCGGQNMLVDSAHNQFGKIRVYSPVTNVETVTVQGSWNRFGSIIFEGASNVSIGGVDAVYDSGTGNYYGSIISRNFKPSSATNAFVKFAGTSTHADYVFIGSMANNGVGALVGAACSINHLAINGADDVATGVNFYGFGTVNLLTFNSSSTSSIPIKTVDTNAQKNVVVNAYIYGTIPTTYISDASTSQINFFPEYLPGAKKFKLMKNNSGGATAAGDVCILDTSDSSGDVYTTTTTGNSPLVIGMVAETTANAAKGYVQIGGKTTKLKVDGTTDIAVADFIATFTTVKIGQKGTVGGGNCFAIALEAYATDDSNGVIDALLVTVR
jgi:hypothetical protein